MVRNLGYVGVTSIIMPPLFSCRGVFPVIMYCRHGMFGQSLGPEPISFKYSPVPAFSRKSVFCTCCTPPPPPVLNHLRSIVLYDVNICCHAIIRIGQSSLFSISVLWKLQVGNIANVNVAQRRCNGVGLETGARYHITC